MKEQKPLRKIFLTVGAIFIIGIALLVWREPTGLHENGVVIQFGPLQAARCLSNDTTIFQLAYDVYHRPKSSMLPTGAVPWYVDHGLKTYVYVPNQPLKIVIKVPVEAMNGRTGGSCLAYTDKNVYDSKDIQQYHDKFVTIVDSKNMKHSFSYEQLMLPSLAGYEGYFPPNKNEPKDFEGARQGWVIR